MGNQAGVNMAIFEGVAIGVQGGDDVARLEGSGQSWTGAAFQVQGSPAPFIERLGSMAFQVALATPAGRDDTNGDVWTVHRIATLLAQITGRHDMTGQLWVGRFIPISAVYKNSDRITLAGVALDLSGQPLRAMQLQFIGETVQEHFAGASTDGNGIYVAYLDTGDTYTAYAFSVGRGFVYKLDHQEAGPNTTTLVFKLLTKRGGFGEGLFLQGGA